ncbi:uncharacterized protein ELE39_002429 [Cryptosporidium sp. chipmunk genotype I]|uniref:uncharacterized protein n=1 Tax=Cryptosporidium sp. chipmunk genotype I TaxID=1280935 RepID=UPI00351A092D|nr:hypothetical protein ELE39_002429 [Cryptosporidium sp. chipmunk genotype I]
MKIIEALRSGNNFYRGYSNNFAKENPSIFYRYDLCSNSCSVPTVVTESKSSSSETTENKMSFLSVDGETLLLLQEALIYHYSGGEGTFIKLENQDNMVGRSDSVYAMAHSPKVVFPINEEMKINTDFEDIFEGVGGIFDHQESKRTRARSLERSLSPDLDKFIEDVYDLREEALHNADFQAGNQSQAVQEARKDQNSTYKGFGLVSNARNRRRNIDYSLLSRRGPASASEKSLRSLKLPQFEDSTSSYAECYLEVDGVSQYETHHEELEPMSVRSQNQEIDDSTSAGDNAGKNTSKFKQRRKGKSVNQEWRSIQKIMNKQNFSSLKTFNSLISHDNGSMQINSGKI